MERLPKRNSTLFPLAVSNALSSIDGKDNFLMGQQLLPVEYFTKNPRARGLLIMSETGTGKTISAVAIANSFIERSRDAIVFVARSLRANFESNIDKYKDNEKDAAGLDKYEFVSSNASNMLAQLRRIRSNNAIDEVLGEIEHINLEGCVIVVDEAHHLFNGIVSGSKNARALYDIIMAAKDVKIVFLTSSVIINTPFEIVPCFNMLAGFELLPTLYHQFVESFMHQDEKGYTAKNLEYLKARIYGLISYYGSWFKTGGRLNIHESVKRPNMPTRLPIEEVFVPMSSTQYAIYEESRREERLQTSHIKDSKEKMSKPGSESSSTYRIRSRQYQNVGCLTPVIKSSEDKTAPTSASQCFNSSDLETVSPKFAAIMKNVRLHGNDHGVIFSAFVENYGIGWIASLLEKDGYTRYTAKNAFDPGKRYAIFTGDVSILDRTATIRAFNSTANKDAGIIHLILGSPAMTEGIDLKRVTHVHIVEAQWHFSTIEQVIARAVRTHSHDDMPADKQIVKPYVYLSEYPTGSKSEKKEPTSDIHMYYKSIKKKVLNDKFFKALIEASIDCTFHIKNAEPIAKELIKCMMCAPTNQPLFNVNLGKQLNMPNPCIQAAAKTINAIKVMVDNREFYYNANDKGGFDIYRLDDRLGSYVKLSPASPWYSSVFSKVRKLITKT